VLQQPVQDAAMTFSAENLQLFFAKLTPDVLYGVWALAVHW
jgi:hypothetical protein